MASSTNISIKKHAGLALYYLAQFDEVTDKLLDAGILSTLVEMHKCERDDIRMLSRRSLAVFAKKGKVKDLILSLNAKSELRRQLISMGGPGTPVK
eukprot:scaffold149_cov383-Prasinococcus_capsulatus_cf.AAC.32